MHALAPRHVSFPAFCAANVLIDFESLYNLVHGRHPVHAFFHTYVGASLIALGIAGLWWAWLRLMRGRFSGGLGMRQVAIGAALGAWTHVLLDSVMHADIQPLQPLSAANGLYRIVSLSALHGGCVAAGVVALLVIGVRRWRAWRA